MLRKLFMLISIFCVSLSRDTDDQILEKLKSIISANHEPTSNTGKYITIIPIFENVVDVDEFAGTVKAVIWWQIHYVLPDAGNILKENSLTSFSVPKDTFWKPNMKMKEVSEIHYDSYEIQHVTEGGFVYVRDSLINFDFGCSLDLVNFPYDEHFCPITFVTTLPTLEHNRLNIWFTKYTTPGLKTSDEWETIGDQYYYLHNNQTLGLFINLRRHSSYFSSLIILPSIALSVLAVLTFLFAPDSGDKISFPVTILLAHVVSLLTVSQILPPNGTHLTYLGRYIVDLVLMMTGVVLAAASVSLIDSIGDSRHFPRFVSRILTHRAFNVFLLPDLPLGDLPSKSSAKSNEMRISQKGELEETEVTENSKLKEDNSQFVDSSYSDSYLWKQLALLIDRVCLLTYIGLFSIFTLIFTVNVKTHKSQTYEEALEDWLSYNA